MEITLLYASLLSILAVFLAYKTGTLRLKTNTLLGAGDSSEMLQSIRAFGNLSEYAPLAIVRIIRNSSTTASVSRCVTFGARTLIRSNDSVQGRDRGLISSSDGGRSGA